MTLKGTIKGNVIELDRAVPLPEGTRVDVTVERDAEPHKGSPQAWLQLAGTITVEESEAQLKIIREEVRRIDPEIRAGGGGLDRARGGVNG